jgi:transmembrane sensor
VNKEIEITDELIARYLNGEATPEEAIALHEWQNQPANHRHFEKLQNAWNSTYPSRAPRRVDLNHAWSKLAINESDVIPITDHEKYSFGNRKIWIGIAASFLLMLGVSAIFYFNNTDATGTSVSVTSIDTVRHIVLPDNSKITMNRNSALRYPERFDSRQRAVQLDSGEAFFNIASDKSAPFFIHTEIADIKVIGTAFNVILTNNQMEVSVDHGKVLVYTSTDSTYLEAGLSARIRSGQTDFNTSSPADRNVWAYATHKFVFQNTPLNEVIRSIEKAQSCSIVLENRTIGNCKLTATFESVSTDYILTLITEAMNLSVTKNGNTFTVGGEGCR